MELTYLRTHGSFFYFHHFSFVADCLIFTVADRSNPHSKKVGHEFLHTRTAIFEYQTLLLSHHKVKYLAPFFRQISSSNEAIMTRSNN